MKIFLDTETSGIKDPALVEIAFNTGGMNVSFRCKPWKDIEIEASSINGISNRDVENLLPFKEMACYSMIKEVLESNTIIGHNVSFDAQVLANEGIFITDSVCTKELAKKKWPNAPSHRLQHLRYWLDLEVEGVAHSAAGDVAVLMALWEALHADSADSTSAVAS